MGYHESDWKAQVTASYDSKTKDEPDQALVIGTA